MDKIKGDFNLFKYWLKSNVLNNFNEYKYDSQKNVIWMKTSDGDIYEYRYDSNHNKIWKKTPIGYIYEWEYFYNCKGMLLKITQDGKTLIKIPNEMN